MSVLRIVLVDAREVYLRGLHDLLDDAADLTVVASARPGAVGDDLAVTRPDVVVVGAGDDRAATAGVLRRLAGVLPGVPCVVLDAPRARGDLGAAGVPGRQGVFAVPKDVDAASLCAAVRRAAAAGDVQGPVADVPPSPADAGR